MTGVHLVRGFESRPLRHLCTAIRGRGESVCRLGLVALLATLVACRAQRTLTITSTPPGALVRLGEDHVGETPLTLEFQHYGTRRVTLTLPGHRTVSRRVELVAPWQARFPLDFFSEVVVPVGWEDHHVVHIDLVAGTSETTLPEISSVLRRAEALRRAGPDGPRELPPVETEPVGEPE